MTEPLGDVPATPFVDSLGARGRRRAEPRTSIAVAGAGCALAVLGVLMIAGDSGMTDGDFNQVPGIVLSALVVAAGFFTLASVRQGAIATAGAVAAALGVPPLMFFITFDEGGLPPYSTDGILIVSTIAWLGAYAIGPARSRTIFLGAGLISLWLTALQLTENLFEAPFGFVGALTGGFTESSFESTGTVIDGSVGSADLYPGVEVYGSGDTYAGGFGQPFEGNGFQLPDPTTIALLSLAFGVGYLLLCRWLDRRGHHGVATPFAVATLPALATGVTFMADDLEQAGTGLLALLVGAGVAYHGATVGRRATAWVGGGTTAIGAAVFLGDMTDDVTVLGMLYLAVGIGLVAAAHAVATALGEPDEMAVTTVARVAGAPGGSAPITPPPGAPGGSAPIPPPPGARPAAPAEDDLSQWMPQPPPPGDEIPPPPGPS